MKRINRFLSLVAVLFPAALLVLFTIAARSPSGHGAGIDVHMHLHGGGGPRGRRPASSGSDGYVDAAAMLVRRMDENGIEKAIVMPPPQKEGQRGGYSYKSLMDAVKQHKGRLYLDPRRKGLRAPDGRFSVLSVSSLEPRD